MEKKGGKNNVVGAVGEELAARYLEERGFSILDRNYRKKWGELDVVAKKGSVIYFVEVKTVSANLNPVSSTLNPSSGRYRPEDNVHPWKLQRMHRAIQTYLMEKKLDTAEWQINVVTVLLDLRTKKAKIELITNII